MVFAFLDFFLPFRWLTRFDHAGLSTTSEFKEALNSEGASSGLVLRIGFVLAICKGSSWTDQPFDLKREHLIC